MTPTRQELKAAIETALEAFINCGPSYRGGKSYAILSSLLATFDAKADFEEAAMAMHDAWLGADESPGLDMYRRASMDAYRRFVAAQEGKK